MQKLLRADQFASRAPEQQQQARQQEHRQIQVEQ
jgi:hypothetical protein